MHSRWPVWREVVSSISLILIFFDLWRGLKNCLVYCCYCMVICWDSMWYIAVGSYKEAIWKQGNLQSIITLVTSLEIDETINTGRGKLICVCSILLNNVNSVWFSVAGSISHMVFGVLLQWPLAVRMSAGALPASPSCAPWLCRRTRPPARSMDWLHHPWVAGAAPELERTGEGFLGSIPHLVPPSACRGLGSSMKLEQISKLPSGPHPPGHECPCGAPQRVAGASALGWLWWAAHRVRTVLSLVLQVTSKVSKMYRILESLGMVDNGFEGRSALRAVLSIGAFPCRVKWLFLWGTRELFC